MSRLIKVAPELSDNKFQNYEELSIYVSLEATTKRKTTVTSENGNNTVVSKKSTILNFNSGNKIGDKNYLTTRYTDANVSFSTDNSNEDFETFGITNIDIDFDSHLTPIFNIEFVDIKGATLLQQGENSKYAAFFQFPYPVFSLTIKGFYGKPVSYCLHLIKYNSKFDSKSGNFIINCEFIGYTYAILSDLLIGYLRAIPYTTKGSENYKLLKEKDPNIIDINEFLTKVSKVNGIVSEFKQSNDNLPTVENSDEYLERLNDIERTISEVYKTLALEYGVGKKNDKINGGVLVRFNNLTDEQKNGIGRQLTIIQNKIKDFNNIEFIKINPSLALSMSMFDNNVYKNIINEGKSVDPEIEDANEIFQAYDIKDGKEKNEFYVFYSFKPLENEILNLKNKIPGIKNNAIVQATTQLQTQVEGALGIPVSIRSLTSILANSADVFLKTLKEVADEANSDQSGNRRNIVSSIGSKREKKNEEIYAFPEYRIADDKGGFKEAWIGKDYPDLVEVKFIEELLDGLVKSKTLDKQIEESILNQPDIGTIGGEIDYAPINILETSLYGNKSSWDYAIETGQLNSPESIVRMIILRAITLLSFTIDEEEDKIVNQTELSIIARLDALKASLSIKDQNIKKSLIDNYMRQGNDLEKICKIAYEGGDTVDLQLNNNIKKIKKPYVINSDGNTVPTSVVGKYENSSNSSINLSIYPYFTFESLELRRNSDPILNRYFLKLNSENGGDSSKVLRIINEEIKLAKQNKSTSNSSYDKLLYSFISQGNSSNNYFGKKYIPLNASFDGSDYFSDNGEFVGSPRKNSNGSLSNFRLHPNSSVDSLNYLKILKTSDYRRFLNSKLTYNYDTVLSDNEEVKKRILQNKVYDISKDYEESDVIFNKSQSVDGLIVKTEEMPSPNFTSDRSRVTSSNLNFLKHHFSPKIENNFEFESFLLFYTSQSNFIFKNTPYRSLFLAPNSILNHENKRIKLKTGKKGNNDFFSWAVIRDLLYAIKESNGNSVIEYFSSSVTQDIAKLYKSLYDDENIVNKVGNTKSLADVLTMPLNEIYNDYTITSIPVGLGDIYNDGDVYITHLFDPINEFYYGQKGKNENYNKALIFLHSLPHTGLCRSLDLDSRDEIALIGSEYKVDLLNPYIDYKLQNEKYPLSRPGLLRNKVIKRLFSLNASTSVVPYTWVLLIGGLLRRYVKNQTMFFPSNLNSYATDEYLTDINMLDYNGINGANFYKHEQGISMSIFPDSFGNIGNIKIEEELLNLPLQVKNEFINEFEKWVDSENDLVDGFEDVKVPSWKYLKENLEIKKEYHISYDYFDLQPNGVLSNSTNNSDKLFANNYNITSSKNKNKVSNYQFVRCKYELKSKTDLQLKLFSLLKSSKAISLTYPIFDVLNPNSLELDPSFNNSISNSKVGYINKYNSTNDNKKYALKSFKRRSFELYIKRFIDGFRLAEGVSSITSTSNPNSQQDINEQILSELQATIKDENIKLAIYRNIKSIYDKWVSGNENGEFFTNCSSSGFNSINLKTSEKRGSDVVNLIDHFKFVDRAMNDIGDDFLVNPLAYAKDVIQDLNKSFYDVINRMLADNYFNFIALPNFVNYNNEDEMKNIFKAFPYDTIEENLSNGPSFICVYAGQTSINLNAPFSDYEDDGIDFEFQDTIPSDFTNEDDSQEINPMVFVVNYGIQNQSFFKDIELDQAEFTETDEGLQIIDDIAQNGAKNSRTFVGQNLFNIYKTRSYSCDITMMGNAMIQPFMYFQLNNIPLFKGGYLITKVSHNISPNTMSTRFKGVRIKAVKTPLITSETLFMNLLGASGDFSVNSFGGIVVGEVSEPGKRSGNSVSFSINKGSQGFSQITTIKGRTDMFDINVHLKDYIIDDLSNKTKYPNINSSQMSGLNPKNKDEACTYVLASIKGGSKYGIGSRMDNISKLYKEKVGTPLYITHANSKYGGKTYFTSEPNKSHASHRDGTCLDIGIDVSQKNNAEVFIKLLLDSFGHYSIDDKGETTIRLHDIIFGNTDNDNKFLKDILKTSENGKYAKYVPAIRSHNNHNSHFHIQFTIPPSIQKEINCGPLGEGLTKPQSSEYTGTIPPNNVLSKQMTFDTVTETSKDLDFSYDADAKNYFIKILQGIGAPVTNGNLIFLKAWRQAEGGKARWNAFNSTQPKEGATNYNSIGVKNYSNINDGIEANVKTILNDLYPNILSGLRKGLKNKQEAYELAVRLQTIPCADFNIWTKGTSGCKKVTLTKDQYVAQILKYTVSGGNTKLSGN